MSKSQLQTFRYPVIAALTLLVVGCMQPAAVEESGPGPTVSTTQTYSYTRDIKPVLDQKCIACHACYDAPCQLKLSSAQGLLRGSTRKQVYDSGRLQDMAPTRLFVDAATPAGWREKGFYSVLNQQGGPPDNNLELSLLYSMIELGRGHSLAANTAVPEHIQLGLQRKNPICPLPAEFERYAEKKPLQGMPLAITGLDENEFQTLRQWILEGAVIDATPAVPDPRNSSRSIDGRASSTARR